MQSDSHLKQSLTVSRLEKETLLQQKGHAVWFYGLSGAGKTTLAHALERLLFAEKYLSILIDGDVMRKGLNQDLGFSEESRTENIRRAAETAKLCLSNGLIVIASFITPLPHMRKMIRDLISTEEVTLVFVNCPLNTLEKRDVKGLYRQARSGHVKDFTGIHQKFLPASDFDIELLTDSKSENECIQILWESIKEKVKHG